MIWEKIQYFDLCLPFNEIWEYIIDCCYSTCVCHVFGKIYGWMPQYWNKNILEKQLYKNPLNIKILAYENKSKPIVQSLTTFQNSLANRTSLPQVIGKPLPKWKLVLLLLIVTKKKLFGIWFAFLMNQIAVPICRYGGC